MIDSFERFVLLYDLCLRTARKHLEFSDLSEQADDIVKYVNANKALLVLGDSDGNQQAPWLRIKRAKKIKSKTGKEFLALLFSVGDPRAANPVFEHSETAKLRIVKKQEKEGSTVSAHCVVALNPSGSSTEQRYRMIVEDIRGLGRTRIRDILAEMFKTLSDEMGLEYENNQGKTVKTWIIPDMQGHRSEKIGESIERGTVSGVHLVDSRSNHAMDELDGAKIVRREMRIEIGAAKVGDKLSVLEEVKSWGADNGFDRLRIVWSDPKGAGKPERASVDTTQQDVKDTYFVKQVKVTVDEPLDQACEEIRDDMVEKIMSKAA